MFNIYQKLLNIKTNNIPTKSLLVGGYIESKKNKIFITGKSFNVYKIN